MEANEVNRKNLEKVNETKALRSINLQPKFIKK
jgi:hypothetical protein